jgi:hypothetical protein
LGNAEQLVPGRRAFVDRDHDPANPLDLQVADLAQRPDQAEPMQMGVAVRGLVPGGGIARREQAFPQVVL